MAQALQRYDRDGDGKLNKEEVKSMFTHMRYSVDDDYIRSVRSLAHAVTCSYFQDSFIAAVSVGATTLAQIEKSAIPALLTRLKQGTDAAAIRPLRTYISDSGRAMFRCLKNWTLTSRASWSLKSLWSCSRC